MKKFKTLLLILFFIPGVIACSPKVGRPEWCKQLKEKDKGDLTVNEAKNFAKHCIFK